MSATLRASESSIESVCGLYTIRVESNPTPNIFAYVVNDEHLVTDIRVNNTYLAVDGRLELECRDFEIVDDVLHIDM